MQSIREISVIRGSSDCMPHADLPPWLWPRAAYIHVPFCAHHCGYCDFAVVAGKDHLADRYLNALEREITTLREPQPVETIFLGGGTPTHLSVEQLHWLLGIIQHWFPVARPESSKGVAGAQNTPVEDSGRATFRSKGVAGAKSTPVEDSGRATLEFTVEANPATLTAEKIAVLAEHGVNRLSLGGQSFQPHVLRVLERDHQPADVARAVEQARTRIPQVSIDLIFGVPGQTLAQWRVDLQRGIELGVDHLSTYGLTYEKGTPLWKQREAGEVQAADEELERAMYELAMDLLPAAGFEQYEISNFARLGRRSRHNQVYWANHAYFGFGLGAARYVQGRREINTRDLSAYLRRAEAGESPVQQAEELSPEERARETAALNLRRAEGINRAAFHDQTGFEIDSLAGAALRRQTAACLLIDDGRDLRLTRQGKLLADSVCSSMLVS